MGERWGGEEPHSRRRGQGACVTGAPDAEANWKLNRFQDFSPFFAVHKKNVLTINNTPAKVCEYARMRCGVLYADE